MTADAMPSATGELVRVAGEGGGIRRTLRACISHINMLGRYAFVLPDGIARGELRPLRDPATASHDEG